MKEPKKITTKQKIGVIATLALVGSALALGWSIFVDKTMDRFFKE